MFLQVALVLRIELCSECSFVRFQRLFVAGDPRLKICIDIGHVIWNLPPLDTIFCFPLEQFPADSFDASTFDRPEFKRSAGSTVKCRKTPFLLPRNDHPKARPRCLSLKTTFSGEPFLLEPASRPIGLRVVWSRVIWRAYQIDQCME
ncbi:unnamed protein product [Caenorhabditis auriculariae]|uniref:Uncharacterized protein n=1 Tax=Caenorhabditis auriculariae TaxID=2777116 RepID=A0A8S1HSX6_9PELO|nr:unnamed protein product [Caenorhabditis auriculariae]